MSKQEDADEKRWFRTRGGAAGPTRRALDAALAGTALTGRQHVTAELARQTADLVDSARRRQDARVWLSASQRLDGLMQRLGLGDDGDAGRDRDADRLAELLGAGPTLGDAAES